MEVALAQQRKVEGKVFIVTGSTSGIGEAIALHLADNGARGVLVTGRNQERGKNVVHEIEKKGAGSFFVPAELSDVEACRTIVRVADDRFGKVDGLVNAAAVTTRGTLDNSTVELWDHIFAVNVRAPFLLCQEAVRVMKREKKGGAIVNVISVSSHGGEPYLTPYSSSKGALSVFTKNIAYALRKERIRVNGINLGWANTPGEHKVQKASGAPENWLELAEQKQAFGRLILPKDVAPLAVHLLSNESEMMTGSLIDFDQNVVGAYD
jgi:NAD(P)-dependent dehydrogenase (short-subunit alcohol dehydrogenase family)